MTLEDLKHIFRQQVAEGIDKLYFMLVDRGYKVIERHPAADMESLLPTLSSFEYHEDVSGMPRFVK